MFCILEEGNIFKNIVRIFQKKKNYYREKIQNFEINCKFKDLTAGANGYEINLNNNKIQFVVKVVQLYLNLVLLQLQLLMGSYTSTSSPHAAVTVRNGYCRNSNIFCSCICQSNRDV